MRELANFIILVAVVVIAAFNFRTSENKANSIMWCVSLVWHVILMVIYYFKNFV